MVTDDQMIKALKTVRQYCKESTECCKCVCHCECDMWFEGRPDIWQIPGDEEDDEIIADIEKLTDEDDNDDWDDDEEDFMGDDENEE